MKSPRPPAKSRLPRGFAPAGCGQSIRRSAQPSGAVQSRKRRLGGMRAPSVAHHLPSPTVTVWKATPSRALTHGNGAFLDFARRCSPLLLLVACWSRPRRAHHPQLAQPRHRPARHPLLVGDRPRRSGRTSALQVGVAALVFALFAIAFALRRDGRRRRQAGRRRSPCGCRAQAVLLLLVIMSLAGGVLTLAMLIAPPARQAAASSSKFPTASPSRSAVCG